MLRKYMSDRGKIRARRVSGNCTQHQRDVAIAIKTARELVLLPYTQRTTTERPGGRGREGSGRRLRSDGARGRSPPRPAAPAAPSSPAAASPQAGAPAADAPADGEVEVVEVVEVAVVEPAPADGAPERRRRPDGGLRGR